MRTHPLSLRTTSVRDDWCAPLPKEEIELYQSFLPPFEATYSMLSVSLNEALGFRASGPPAATHHAIR